MPTWQTVTKCLCAKGRTHRPHAQRLPLLVVASAEARGAQLRKCPNRHLALVRRHSHRAACIVKLHQWGNRRCAARQDCDLAHHASCQCVECFCQCRGGARQGKGQACVASLAQLRVDGQRVPAEASRPLLLARDGTATYDCAMPNSLTRRWRWPGPNGKVGSEQAEHL
jgi:hypothetical protein